jgi:hypothetical protein
LSQGAAKHQLDAVEVDWLPVVAVDFESEALFVARRVNHYCTAVFAKFDDSLPEQVSDPCCDDADEYAGADFQEPSG